MYKTKNLGLNITEIEKDKLDAFSFKIDLGDNFEAIDSKTLTHRNITNCLLEVPQDIKLELKDGVLTLKGGSVLYKPNGIGVFEKITINSDVTRNNFDTASNQIVIFYNTLSNSFSWYTLNQNIYSGDVAPTNPITQSIWYDTANNVFKYTGNAGVDWTEMFFTMPIAIVTRTNGIPTSIDQVFNGFGYIGSTVFVLPGVKGLVPNGRNEDGSLKNIVYTVSDAATYTWDALTGNFENYIFTNNTITGNSGWAEYKEKENVFWDNSTSRIFLALPLCNTTVLNGVVTSLTHKLPFKAVDYNNYQSKITELETKIQALQAAVEALQG